MDEALAVDYDGTLAKDGRVDQATVESLGRWRDSGRRLILVTGRRLEPLLEIFPEIALFDRVVAENGGVLYAPGSLEPISLAESPPTELVETLRRWNIPLEVGLVVIATRVPHEAEARKAIRDLQLDWSITFNKGAVMILPGGVTKASGLEAALRELELSPRKTAGIGDAENDEAFLRLCGLKIAVANALPTVKELADVVTKSERGSGVAEWIDQHLSGH